MKPFPPLPDVDATPDLFESGHLWLQELVAGAPLRLQLAAEGTLTVADRTGPLDDPPPSLRASVTHIERSLNRSALLAAADDPSSVVVYGVATRFEGVLYDWERLPPFLVTDVWSGERGEYLPPDVVERTAERLGLAPVNALQKEVDARHFDVADYDPPGSAWYDGPVAGVVVRNKTGDRAARRTDPGGPDHEPLPTEPSALAAAVVTERRVQRAAERLASPGFDGVFDAVLAAVAREEYARLPEEFGDREHRSAVAERVGALWG